jgi:hypothetical protein
MGSTPLPVQAAAAAELLLSVAEASGLFPGYLPLGGSHASQLSLVCGGGMVLHELAKLAADVRAWLKSFKCERNEADRMTGHKDQGTDTHSVPSANSAEAADEDATMR